MVQKGIERYWNYGNYSTQPTFINQGIYDNRRIFVEIPRYVWQESFYWPRNTYVSYRDFSTNVTPPI